MGDTFRPFECLNGANIRRLFQSRKQMGKILREFKKNRLAQKKGAAAPSQLNTHYESFY